MKNRLKKEWALIREFILSWLPFHPRDVSTFTQVYKERRYYRTILLLHKFAIAFLIVQWLLAAVERADYSMQVDYLNAKLEQDQGLLADGTVVLRPGGRLIVKSVLGDSRVVSSTDYAVVKRESLEQIIESRNPFTRALIAKKELHGIDTGLEN